jgi:uncharacterized repeat protein (TIGR01451 family)
MNKNNKATELKQKLLISAVAFATIAMPAYAAQVIDTSCDMVTTSIMPSGDRTHANNANFSSVIGFDYDTRGYEAPATPTPTQIASAVEVGTVWGKAYDATNKKLYAAAFLRRHAPMSPDGLGAIYEIDVSDTTSDATIGTPTLWMDLNSTAHLGAGATLFPSETDANRGLSSPFSPSYDVWAFDKVARQGIGGLELSDDYSTMYAMDLTNRQLLVIDVATKTVTARHSLAQQSVADDLGCKDLADVRPFGVDYLDGDVYVGVSCSDETDQNGNADATAHVMRLSGTTFSEVVNGSLRGYYWSHYWELDPTAVGCSASDRGTYVPMITNMELDEFGNMMIGVMGVNGWRYASDNYAPDTGCTSLLGEHSVHGYVLHATPNGSNWDVAATEETDNGTYNHRYAPGQFVHWGDGNSHTYQGGMSLTSCSGTEVAIVNLMDPMNHESGGTRWMRTSDAQQEAHEPSDGIVTDADKTVAERSTLELYQGNNTGDNWEKSAGMGDIEYLRTSTVCSLTASATVSACTNVGNDSDASNDTFTIDLTVEGVNTGASTTYNYTSTSGNISGSGTYSATAETDGPFVISATTTPFDLTITDSADTSCTVPVSSLVTPATCSSANPQIDLSVTKIISPASVSTGDTATYTITVTNNGPGDATGVEVTDQLPAGVTYSTHNASQGAYTNGTGIWTVGDLANGASATLTITVTAD